MPPSVPLGARTPRPSPCRHSPSSQPPSPTSSEERSAHLRPPQLPPNSAALPSERPSGRAPQPPPVESSTTSGRCRSFSPSESAGRPAPQLASLAAAEGEELVSSELDCGSNLGCLLLGLPVSLVPPLLDKLCGTVLRAHSLRGRAWTEQRVTMTAKQQQPQQNMWYKIAVTYLYVFLWIGLSCSVILYNKYILDRKFFNWPFPIRCVRSNRVLAFHLNGRDPS